MLEQDEELTESQSLGKNPVLVPTTEPAVRMSFGNFRTLHATDSNGDPFPVILRYKPHLSCHRRIVVVDVDDPRCRDQKTGYCGELSHHSMI